MNGCDSLATLHLQIKQTSNSINNVVVCPSQLPYAWNGLTLSASGTYTATDGFLTQMIQSNRNNGIKGETYFFYEGIKDRAAWFQGQYPFIK
jgi:hypothetical protein